MSVLPNCELIRFVLREQLEMQMVKITKIQLYGNQI